MKKGNSKDLTQGKVGPLLASLTLPMIFGMLGFVIFNLVDTYFVGKLGVKQMAALTFTFPIVLVINSINHGLGVGASAVISKAVGENDGAKVKRLATDSLILGVLFSLVAVLIGEATIVPLFRALGADRQIMPYIVDYMTVWYGGAPFIVIPMIGNNVIRALGDTKTPSLVMVISAVTNMLLDPLLIFGWGLIPGMGVRGAAIATVCSRGLTFTFAMYVLGIREGVIVLQKPPLYKIIASWKAILFIGVPNAISKMILPLGSGIITGLVATFGTQAVAGYGIATKIEFLSVSVLMALSSVMPVFVGQNFGARRFDRIEEGVKKSKGFALAFGLFMFIVLALLGRPIAGLFTQDKAVSDSVVLYLRIVPLGYGFQGLLQILNGSFNAIQQPMRASAINVTQMLVIYVPLAIWASSRYGIIGIFGSLVCSYLIVGLISQYLFKKSMAFYLKGDPVTPA